MANQSISKNTRVGIVEGVCDPAFSIVLDAFCENFESRDELGASVCISVKGRTVVDIWGGRIAADGAPWTRDTISIVFSATKGASALCAHMAVDRGQLDLDAPVTRYWPEFGQAGKEGALVSMMLDHSVGLPHVRTTVKKGGSYDYDNIVDLLDA
jgi:CubicO group peptidase (beta-lactamase class C family)